LPNSCSKKLIEKLTDNFILRREPKNAEILRGVYLEIGEKG